MAVEIKLTSELAVQNHPATIEVYENGSLVGRVVAKIEREQGGDGGQYPVVKLALDGNVDVKVGSEVAPVACSQAFEYLLQSFAGEAKRFAKLCADFPSVPTESKDDVAMGITIILLDAIFSAKNKILAELRLVERLSG